VNADAVAEQTILLMLGLLRSVTAGDAAVRAGQQIQRKEYMMVNGITELGECRVGLIGFGDIAKAVAKRLISFGCDVFYNATHARYCGALSEKRLLSHRRYAGKIKFSYSHRPYE